VTAINGEFCLRTGAVSLQTRARFRSSRFSGVWLCTRYVTAGVGKRVRSTSLYHSRQCAASYLNRAQMAQTTPSFALWRASAADSCDKKSLADAKGNARQRCMCEGPVRTKSKLTTMFHLDSTADDA